MLHLAEESLVPKILRMDSRGVERINQLLEKMTLAEKVGQLNQLRGGMSTGTEQNRTLDTDENIRRGLVGTMLNVGDLADKRRLQKLAVEKTRLGIPLIFAHDVIHGYRTIFPIPLGLSCSWNLEGIEASERISATETASFGIHWTFAPMVDIARDPRWGRVMESSGEDTWLGTQIARARVNGLQGDDLSRTDTVLACAKHFAAYGAAEGGREYNTVDVSERVLREVYLPPFEACAREGAATFMNAFNVIDRIPASCHSYLLRDILKGEWNFAGAVVSDYNSFYEVINHGCARDPKEAAKRCLEAGSDIDMMGRVYYDHLEELVEQQSVAEALLDDAVARVLRLKVLLGLFDDPNRYFCDDRHASVLLTESSRALARTLVAESCVLLQNNHDVLPLAAEKQSVALIGQLAHSRKHADLIGSWSAAGRIEEVVTLLDGFQVRMGEGLLHVFTEMSPFGGLSDAEIAGAVATADKADIAVLVLGENGTMSGECTSRTNIGLPGRQIELAKAIKSHGKPVVALIAAGRPLDLTELSQHADAILMIWQPGTMAGAGVADIVFGDANPCGKLTNTFPRTVGQVPIYHNELPTGRLRRAPDDSGVSMWADCPNEPLYPFGFGLSYTKFETHSLRLNTAQLCWEESLKISLKVRNTGSRDGIEIVQLYIRDLHASVSRPVKELKGFQRVPIAAGETVDVEFSLNRGDLAFWNQEMKYEAEPGHFLIMVGPDSCRLQEAGFELCSASR